MKKILLINPAFKGSMHSNIKVLAIPPLNLAMIARYTPEQYEVEIASMRPWKTLISTHRPTWSVLLA